MDAESRRAARALGVPEENMPPEEEDESDAEMFEVWDTNWPAMLLFLRCETQWRVVSTFGGLIWLGIDYVAATAVLAARPRSEQRRRPAGALLDDLRIMESEASAVLNEKPA